MLLFLGGGLLARKEAAVPGLWGFPARALLHLSAPVEACCLGLKVLNGSEPLPCTFSSIAPTAGANVRLLFKRSH